MDGYFRVRGYVGQRCLPECVSNDIVAEHQQLWSGMQFRIIDDKVNSKKYARLVLQTEVTPFLQGISLAIF